jgi:hypothetical protein
MEVALKINTPRFLQGLSAWEEAVLDLTGLNVLQRTAQLTNTRKDPRAEAHTVSSDVGKLEFVHR